jgi:hypothetical protein
MPERGLLDTPPALLERVTGEAHDVEGVHHRDRVGELLESLSRPLCKDGLIH